MYQIVIFTDVTDNLSIAPSIGAFKCAHALRKNGYSCLVVGHLSEYSLSELKELLTHALSDRTVLIGFSRTFFKNIEVTVEPGSPVPPYNPIPHSDMFPQGKQFEGEIFAFVKTIAKNAKIVAGGNISSSKNISNRYVDYVCLGNSEAAIVALADHLAHGAPLKDQTKNIHGRILLDGSKYLGYDFALEDMAWLDTDVVNHKVLPVEIGRGCIFKCKFCSFPLIGKKNLDFVKSTDNLYKELLDNYKNFGIEHYSIVDDTFNDHPEKMKMVLEAIKRLPFNPKFWAYVRLDLLSTRPDAVDMLYDMGVRAFYFGIETLNSKTGRIVGKGYDREKQINTIRYIKEKYKNLVTLHGSFIVGLPNESMESIQRTFDALLSGEIPLDTWYVNPLNIRKTDSNAFSSEFDNYYKDYGYVDTGTPSDQVEINWANEYMDYNIAAQKASDFMCTSNKSIPIDGQTLFSLSTYGLDLQKLIADRKFHYEFDWHNLEKNVKPKFIQEYKQTLLKLVQLNSVQQAAKLLTTN
jgi:radical SAM superfamily enzyme YgiQ (UPF0313 family)